MRNAKEWCVLQYILSLFVILVFVVISTIYYLYFYRSILSILSTCLDHRRKKEQIHQKLATDMELHPNPISLHGLRPRRGAGSDWRETNSPNLSHLANLINKQLSTYTECRISAIRTSWRSKNCALCLHLSVNFSNHTAYFQTIPAVFTSKENM